MANNPADQNPYSPPQTPGQAAPIASEDAGRLVRIAKAQRFVCLAILIGLGSGGVAYAISNALSAPQVGGAPSVIPILIPLGIQLAAGALQAIAAYQLARWTYRSAGVGAALAFCSFFGCLGLIFLAFVNSKATEILKKNGVHVGFLGPPSDEIGRLEQLARSQRHVRPAEPGRPGETDRPRPPIERAPRWDASDQ